MDKHKIAKIVCSVILGILICYLLYCGIRVLQFFGYMEWLNLSDYGL
jgi:hypothetical protein